MVDSRVFTVFRGMQKCLGGSKYRGLADVLSSKTVLSECQQVGVLSAFAHGPEDRVRVDPGGGARRRSKECMHTAREQEATRGSWPYY